MIPLSQLVVSALFLNSPAPNPAIKNDCQDVRGQIEARVDVIRATVAGLRFKGAGSSTGAFTGPVQLDVLKRFTGALEISLRFEASQGALSAHGKASAPVHPSLPDTREISSDLQVRGESGAFHLLSGTLTAQGTVDTRARTLRVDFTGQICQAAQQQFGIVDTSPTATRQPLENQLWGRD